MRERRKTLSLPPLLPQHPVSLTSHAEIALSPTESQTTPSKSKAQTLLGDLDAAAAAIELVQVEEEVEEVDFDRRQEIASREVLLLLLL